MKIEEVLNRTNKGGIFLGQTWQYIFDYMENKKDPDLWIDNVNGVYKLVAADNSRFIKNRIPKTLYPYIEQHLSNQVYNGNSFYKVIN